MNAERADLPMAIAGCTLDPVELDAQVERYRRLGVAASSIERHADQLLITFYANIDPELVEATIATERRCCPFVRLDYNAQRRRLSVTVDDPSRLDTLDVVLAAIRRGAPGASEH